MHLPKPRRLAACLLALLLLPLASSRADDEGGPGSQQAAVNRIVAQLRPLVAEIRGLEWKREVPAEVLSREALEALLEQQLAEEVTPEEMERDTRITRRLGIIAPDEDLLDLSLLMMREMVAGAYDPKTKKLYLIEGFAGEAQKPTLVHELVHALDDQHYDIRALEEPYREQDPDRQFALRCVIEGSAELARRIYQDREPDAALAYYEQTAANKELAAGQQRVMESVPTHMLLSALMHYRVGPNFVAHAVAGDYPGGMRRLWQDPPLSQEQVLHPHKWLGRQRDYPRRVVWGADLAKAAGPGWRRLDEHSVGELDLAVYLDFFLGDLAGRLNTKTMGQGKFVSAMANRAARGWDAGRALYLERDDGHIIVIAAYAFDTVRDAAEAADILGAAQRKASGEAWVGLGWKRDAEDVAERRTFDYAGLHGYGFIRQRGREVLLLDGAPAQAFLTLAPALERTSFPADPRDRGDDAEDPFADCVVVDHQRGLGLRLPSEAWRAERSGRTPYSFAEATNGRIALSFLVLDQEVSRAGLPRVGRMVLRDAFDEAATRPARLMGQGGLVHPLPAPPGERRRLYLASDTARTYVVIAGGPEDAWQEAAGEIQILLDGAAADGEHAAGLRSIPGY